MSYNPTNILGGGNHGMPRDRDFGDTYGIRSKNRAISGLNNNKYGNQKKCDYIARKRRRLAMQKASRMVNR